jgi:carboxypeptidase C (cathepsin A)
MAPFTNFRSVGRAGFRLQPGLQPRSGRRLKPHLQAKACSTTLSSSRRLLVLATFGTQLLFVAIAQTPPPPPSTPATSAAAERFPAPPAVEKLQNTQHSIQIDGRTINYTATAGTLVLKKENKPTASIFFVAYTRDDIPDKSQRPVTFAFNGGPGAASIWLHMGAFGPKRVVMGPNGEQPPPPYRLVDNEDSLIDLTDLVFIDPVTTGYSRNAPGEDPKQFHGLEGDLNSVASFIQEYTNKFNRWSSPKFLAGESYGTTRAAGLAETLLDQGIYLNGITFISSVLNFEAISFSPGNELPYPLFLPTYTATAWHFKKLPPDLQAKTLEQALQAARDFASNEYTLALMKGARLAGAERVKAIEQTARFTGLSKQYVEESNLRIQPTRFRKELLRSEGRTLGRYDTRLEGTDRDSAGATPEYDPSYSSVLGAFTATFNDYVRQDLKWETDLTYEALTDKVQPWSYERYQNRYVDTGEMLRQAMDQIPSLHTLVVGAYYDLATPFFSAEYTFNHLGLSPSLQENVKFAYCDAGHMLYTYKPCLDTLKKSMTEFYRWALIETPAGSSGRASGARQ